MASETTDEIREVRSTAPQSPFTSREVVLGFVIFVVGVIVVAGIPLLATL